MDEQTLAHREVLDGLTKIAAPVMGAALGLEVDAIDMHDLRQDVIEVLRLQKFPAGFIAQEGVWTSEALKSAPARDRLLFATLVLSMYC